MRVYILLLFLIVIVSCDTGNTIDAPSESYFVKFYGEDGDHQGVDFVVNGDGSFVLVGNERVLGAPLSQQIFVVKVDGQGMILKQGSFGLAGDDFVKDIELTPDGNIIIAAENQKNVNDKDVYLITLSQDLSLLNSKQVGLKKMDGQESDEEVNSVTIIQNGYIVSGSTTAVSTTKQNDIRDALHLRFNNTLSLVDDKSGLWKHTSGLDNSEDVLIKMFEVNPFTYYGFGYTNTQRGTVLDYKYWAFSLGASGLPTNNGSDLLDVIGDPIQDEKLSNVIESPLQSGEGFVLSGVKRNSAGESHSFIVKLQKSIFASGDVLEKSPTNLGDFSNVANANERMVNQTRMLPLAGGGFLLLTNSNSVSNDNLNISLTKLDNNFSVTTQIPIFFGGAGDDFNGAIKELSDGKIVIVGTMTLGGVSGQTKMVFMKLNSNGRLQE